MQFGTDLSMHVGTRDVDRLYIGTALVWKRPGAAVCAPMIVGGGGWVTGLEIQGDAMYARTDVGGAYRYNRVLSRWEQMITVDAVAIDPTPSDYNVEALACSRSHPNRVYLACGSGGDGRVLASTDGGRTWPICTPRNLLVSGNSEARFAGRRLEVDPSDPNVVYHGTRCDGLRISQDGGRSWSQIDSLPAAVGDAVGNDSVGITCVLVDPRSALVGGRHQILWVAVFGVGLLVSTDGGDSWTVASPWASPGAYVSDLAFMADGALVGAFYSPVVSTGEVRRIRPGGEVSDISPRKHRWRSVAPHPTNADQLYLGPDVISQFHDFYRSSNATQDSPSWWAMTDLHFAGGVRGDWLADHVMHDMTYPAMYVGQLRYDGDTPILADGTGIWTVTPSSGSSVTFAERHIGVEELVANSIVKPAGSPAVSTQWDYGYIRHGAPASLPYRTEFGSGWDAVVSPTDPSFLAVLMDDHQDPTGRYMPSRRASGWSGDGGKTVTRFEALSSGRAPADMLFGNLAIAAHDNDNIVWLPSNLTGTSSKVYYTLDRGKSWAAGSLEGLSRADVLHPAYYYARHVLTAHASEVGCFYILGHNANTYSPVMWRSLDRGATWQKLTTSGLWGGFGFNSTLLHDGRALWAVPGDGGAGIFRSEDGQRWQPRIAVTNAQRLGVGAAYPGTNQATLFTFGRVGGENGVLMSTDAALSWRRVDGYPLGNFAGVRHIAGDPEVPGRAYIALGGGNGFVSMQA